ncbi:MAG: alpha/beta hydrolase [Planctomycetaceae bacterium]
MPASSTADPGRFPAVTARAILPILAALTLPAGPILGRAAGQPAQAPAAAPGAAATAPAGDAPAKPAGERLKLATSDGFTVAAWHYPAKRPETDGAPPPPPPVAILLHDLGGSHQSLEPLALELQSRGITAVVPDLRGHGATKGPEDRILDPKSIKKADFDAMVTTSGGRVRDQAANRGDVEAVRTWIKEQSEAGKLDGGRLVVVGSGVGAAVAAQWAAADAAWPDLASGAQGRTVRGLVLVSPAWTTRGFSISPALAAEPVRRTLPVLVIGGVKDADATKIYDQLKRQRPDAWKERRPGQREPRQAPKLEEAKEADDARPSLYLWVLDTQLTGDRLAAWVPRDRAVAGDWPADLIERFLSTLTDAAR